MSGSDPRYSLPLALGELSAVEMQELRVLKDLIWHTVGFHCDSYKESCLRRRIAVRMRARGVHTYSNYCELLSGDEAEQQTLLDTITINVSKFYRNPALWSALTEHLVPHLFESAQRPVRIWSAGCAAGEEPYTIAMVLKEYGRRVKHAVSGATFQVLGTDIDAGSLQHARYGRYHAYSFGDIPDAVRRSWFRPPDFTEIGAEIRNLVRFERKDLLRDAFEPGQQLIFCRNVIIYLERAMQEELFIKFHQALAPGGVLVLGKVETMFGRAAALFKPLIARERVFVKV